MIEVISFFGALIAAQSGVSPFVIGGGLIAWWLVDMFFIGGRDHRL